MFWNLLLAHFIGDFLLQTDWMVRNRDRFWVLTLHVSIHLGAMLLLIGDARSEYWVLILLIALIHFGQDALKIFLVRKLPAWSVPAFILDQILHYSIIWAFVWFYSTGTGNLALAQKTNWVLFGISYIFVTFVWFITEKVIYQRNPDHIVRINETKYSRMLARSGMVSVFLLMRAWVFPGLAIVLPNPYSSTEYRQQFLLTDLGVSTFAFEFLFWALG
jgi:hypothetical protein